MVDMEEGQLTVLLPQDEKYLNHTNTHKGSKILQACVYTWKQCGYRNTCAGEHVRKEDPPLYLGIAVIFVSFR